MRVPQRDGYEPSPEVEVSLSRRRYDYSVLRCPSTLEKRIYKGFCQFESRGKIAQEACEFLPGLEGRPGVLRFDDVEDAVRHFFDFPMFGNCVSMVVLQVEVPSYTDYVSR